MHRVEVDRRAEIAIVRASGELDAFAAPDLSSAFGKVTGEARVVADLGPVTFLDSTALGLVVRAVRELTEAGAEVRVVLPGGHARRIFELTSLDRLLPIAESRSAAIDALG
jgi:anti-sigma B factor antagonist